MSKAHNERFRLACKMLRSSTALDKPLPEQKRGESTIDWLVRFGLARDPETAAEMLLFGKGGQKAVDAISEVLELQKQDPAPQKSSATP